MINRDHEDHHPLDDLIEEYLVSDNNNSSVLDEFTEANRVNLDWDDNLGEKDSVGKKIKEGIDHKIAIINRQKRNRKFLLYASSAAAAILLIVSFSVVRDFNPKGNRTLSVETTSKPDSVLLADGTNVYLSPNSIFSYPEKFNNEIRNVSLNKGNAFFKVARNPQKPFVVTSGDIKTKVLGTSFNIHMNKDNYYVVVHTGKVNVSSKENGVDLVPFQEAKFSKENHQFTVRSVSEQEINPWYNSDITLTNQTLETILKVVVRKYGIERYDIDPELLKVKATVFISNHDSLIAVLKQINYITNLKLNANEEIITNDNSVNNLIKQ